jgi:hypothetical protein
MKAEMNGNGSLKHAKTNKNCRADRGTTTKKKKKKKKKD